MENLHSRQTPREHFLNDVCKSKKQQTQKFLSKQKSNNNDILESYKVDKTRLCGTCKSPMLVGFNFCTECGDTNPKSKKLKFQFDRVNTREFLFEESRHEAERMVKLLYGVNPTSENLKQISFQLAE